MRFLVALTLSILALANVLSLQPDMPWCIDGFRQIWLDSIVPGFFDEEIRNITREYNCGKAATCRDKLQKTFWYRFMSFSLQQIRLDCNHESHLIDTKTCDRVKRCNSSKICQSVETERGRKEMLELGCNCTRLLLKVKYDYVLRIVHFLNNCTFSKS